VHRRSSIGRVDEFGPNLISPISSEPRFSSDEITSSTGARPAGCHPIGVRTGQNRLMTVRFGKLGRAWLGGRQMLLTCSNEPPLVRFVICFVIGAGSIIWLTRREGAFGSVGSRSLQDFHARLPSSGATSRVQGKSYAPSLQSSREWSMTCRIRNAPDCFFLFPFCSGPRSLRPHSDLDGSDCYGRFLGSVGREVLREWEESSRRGASRGRSRSPLVLGPGAAVHRLPCHKRPRELGVRQDGR